MIVSRNPSSYRLGLGYLGQGIGPGTLNCPGDPGCPGGGLVPPAPVGDAAFWSMVGGTAGEIAGLQLAANPPPVPTGPLAPLISTGYANPNLIWWGVGIVAAVALLSGRR